MYIRTDTLLLSVHATQLQQAVEEEREFSNYIVVCFNCREWDYVTLNITP